MIKSGQLRQTIAVQTNTDSRDAFGGVTNSWGTAFTTRASINEIRGTERAGSDQVTYDKGYRIIFRVDPDQTVTPANRIVFGSKTFDIESVADFEERGHFYECVVTEREN